MFRHCLMLLFAAVLVGYCTIGSAWAAEPLIIGVEDKDWAGHYSWKGQALTGIDAEIVRRVGKRLGYEIVFQGYPWKRVIQMAEDRELDGVLDLAPTARRQLFLFYSETPLSFESTVFWVRKGGLFRFNGTFDLNTRLGLMRGSDWSDRFARQGTPTVVRFDSYISAFRSLVEGRIDAFGNYLAPTSEHALRTGFRDQIEPTLPMLEHLPYHIAFTYKSGHRELAKRFSEEMKLFFESKEYKELCRRYGHGAEYCRSSMAK